MSNPARLSWLLLATLSTACSGDAGEDTGPSSRDTPDLGSPGDSATFGVQEVGIATYYAATGEGACLFDASPSNLMVAAINAEQWQTSAWCGACVDITGPSGQARVRIVDLCPECASGHLDLSPEAFSQIAELEQGRVDITWQLVECSFDVPVAYRYKDGANEWSTAVQVLDHRLPIESMEYSKDGSNFSPMIRTDYNYFLTEDGFGEGDTAVRITAVDGQTLTDVLPPVEELLLFTGQAQFD